MALSAGSVTVSDEGTASGSGLALAFYQGFMTGVPVPANDPMMLPAARACAQQCEAMATAIIDHITTNAEISLSGVTAHVTTESLGEVESTPIDPPAAPVDIPLSGTGTIA